MGGWHLPYHRILVALFAVGVPTALGLLFRAFSGSDATGGLSFFVFLGLALVSGLMALRFVSRVHLSESHPTSRIASAAQGYVELAGRARLPFGYPLLNSNMYELAEGVGFVWYRYEIHHRDEDGGFGRWQMVDAGETDQMFLLEDSSGEVFVDPEDAAMFPAHFRRYWHMGNVHKEWYIVPGEEIYALGEFSSVKSEADGVPPGVLLSQILEEWKQDWPGLLRRFDDDRDGHLNDAEWESARRAAQDELHRLARLRAEAPETHVVRRPPTGARPMIVASGSAETFVHGHRRLAWGFFGSSVLWLLCAMLWLLFFF